jgi:hypothetical protein
MKTLGHEGMRLILTMSSTPASAETIKRYYRVDRREIAFIKFIFEAYDGIAVLETLDPKAGMVVFHIAPGCEPEADAILQDLKKEIMIEPVHANNELVSSKLSSTL